MRENAGKMQTRRTPNTDTFWAVQNSTLSKRQKVKHDLTSEVFESIFLIKNNSTEMRSKSDLHITKINTKCHGKKIL